MLNLGGFIYYLLLFITNDFIAYEFTSLFVSLEIIVYLCERLFLPSCRESRNILDFNKHTRNHGPLTKIKIKQ